MRFEDINPAFQVTKLDYARPQGFTRPDVERRFHLNISSYLDLIGDSAGFELIHEEVDNRFIISFMGIGDIMTFMDTYPFLQDMGNCIFFATDGDLSYLYAEEGEHRGVYRIETSVSFWQAAEFIANTIDEMLINGTGLI